MNFQTLINYDRLYVGGGNARILSGSRWPVSDHRRQHRRHPGRDQLWEMPEH